MSESKNDFSKGNVYKIIVSLAIPMIFAQLVQVMYNVVDRIYIGHLPGTSSTALTGLGLTFPVVTLILAFTNLFGMGGAPLCSIERGRKNDKKAELIMGNTFAMLVYTAFALMVTGYLVMKPMLYMFGASEKTYVYAASYLKIYLIGTPFVMLSAGMNGFINSQGFAGTGMMTTLIGAALNILLDPIFIFVLNMGVKGAAIATVISQFVSCIWVMRFLLGKKTLLLLRRENMRIVPKILKDIVGIGMAGFIMAASTGFVQITYNSTLKSFGGDVYVGIMTIFNSLRDVIILPAQGLSGAAQPVIGYNYGAKEYPRIKKAITFISISSILYMGLCQLLVMLFPKIFIHIFNSDPELVRLGVPAMRIYFSGFFILALQSAGQSVFVGMGLSKHAVFFSILRKVIIVIPLTLILPRLFGLGVNGVFTAEPVSNFIGGFACYITMLFTVRRILNTEEKKSENA